MQRWNYEPAAYTERVRVGNSLPVGCARRTSIPTRMPRKLICIFWFDTINFNS